MPQSLLSRLRVLTLAGALCSCLFTTSATEWSADRALAYRVAIDGGGGAKPACKVRIRIGDWPSGEPLLFQAPRFYCDNPALPVHGMRAVDIRAEDAAGNALAAKDTAIGSGLDGNFIVLPPRAAALEYAVDLDPADPARFGVPFPNLAEGVQAIDGAYFFLLPVVGGSISAQWRNAVRVSLDFSLEPGMRLVGHALSSDLRTNYELMFVRAAVNPTYRSDFAVGAHTVTTYSMTRGLTGPDSMDWDAFNILIAKCIKVVEDSLLPLPPPHYYVGESPVFFGIEGDQGYWFKAAAQSLPYVHTHELTHTFVGVLHGDLDDPWWKEGMTNYIGDLLAVQAGLLPDTSFRSAHVKALAGIPAVEEYALSSPYVRDHLFSPLDTLYVDKPDARDFLSLVYGKGAQASMILDRYLLERSGGRHSVFDLVRLLIRRHGQAFGRRGLVEAVDELAGTGSGGFLAGLLDKPGAYSLDSLERTYAALGALGRFAVSEANPPAAKAGASAGPTVPGAPGTPSPIDAPAGRREKY